MTASMPKAIYEARLRGNSSRPSNPTQTAFANPGRRNLNLGHQEHPIWHSTRPFRNLGHIDQELYRSPIPPRGSSPPGSSRVSAARSGFAIPTLTEQRATGSTPCPSTKKRN